MSECYIQTFTGIKFHPMEPVPKEINITDIAHALSMQCRYTGHVTEFYSVAEHSIRVARLVPPELKLQALLHDASEAYVADINRPVKKMLPAYIKIEDGIMEVVAHTFGFKWPMSEEVATADNILLVTERRDLLVYTADKWEVKESPDKEVIIPMRRRTAELEFLRNFHYIKRHYNGG